MIAMLATAVLVTLVPPTGGAAVVSIAGM